MNLKEAFRYQNRMNEVIEIVYGYLECTENIMKTTVEHLRKKANPAAENETVDMSADRQYEYSVNDMMDFLEGMIKEKENLYTAILKAKRGLDFDMDSQIDLNMKRQRISRLFRQMSVVRPSEVLERGKGRDFTFNQEGNQVTYCYDLRTVSVIDFDRNKAKKMANKLICEADEASAEIDKIMVNTEVEYTPVFEVNDSFEDIFESWLRC